MVTMKRTILALFALAAVTVWSADVIFYDPDPSAVVTNRVTGWLQTVNAKDYNTRGDALVVDDLPAGIERRWWKVWAGTPQPLSETDTNALEAAQAARQAELEAIAKTNTVQRAIEVYTRNQEAQEKAHLAATITIFELMLPQINTLRDAHALPPITVDQVRSAFIQAYTNRLNQLLSE